MAITSACTLHEYTQWIDSMQPFGEVRYLSACEVIYSADELWLSAFIILARTVCVMVCHLPLMKRIQRRLISAFKMRQRGDTLLSTCTVAYAVYYPILFTAILRNRHFLVEVAYWQQVFLLSRFITLYDTRQQYIDVQFYTLQYTICQFWKIVD